MCHSLLSSLAGLAAETDPCRLMEMLLRALLAASGGECGAVYLLGEGLEEVRLWRRFTLPEVDGFPDFLPADGGDLREKELLLPLPGAGGTALGAVLIRGARNPGKNTLWQLEQLAFFGGASLSKTLRAEALRGQLWRFVKTFVSAMDEGRKYHPRHTRNMAALAEKFLDRLEARGEPVREREAFLLAVWLHDVGKLTVPARVLDKNGRMSSEELRAYLQYVEYIRVVRRLHWANSSQNYEGKYLPQAAETRQLLGAVNWSPELTEYQRMELDKLADFCYRDREFKLKSWFTPRQYTLLSVRKGIYTPQETAAYESHVTRLAQMLDSLRLLPEYQNAAQWAADHHERLDGSGYPLHLKSDEIARETRILSILDVYETLTGRHTRTYPAQTPERALRELRRQAAAGKLDARLVEQFAEALGEVSAFPQKES